MVSLIIHGGAWDIPENKLQPTYCALEELLPIAFQMLFNGIKALDVVEYVVKTLEDNPIFDAGVGSYPNLDGEVEMDAIIVDGKNLKFGSIAGLSNIQNPICVARKVLDSSRHCMLIGSGALEFALKSGFEYVETNKLLNSTRNDKPLGTVGAVALDKFCNIAAATSTGGIPDKLPGRVGDTPLIGCGAVADNSIGGVSATGDGESMMKIMISKEVLIGIENGYKPIKACQLSIEKLEKKTGGHGGVICMNNLGEIGFAYNTRNMTVAYTDSNGNKKVSV